MDDEQFFDSVLATENNFNFKELRTIPVCSIHAIISLLISIIGAFLAFFWVSDTECEEYFLILYIRCIYWALTFIYDHVIKYQHEQLRMYGYHEFYRATLIHKGIPLHIVSLWNTVILCIQTIMQHQYGSDFFAHCTKNFFSPTTYICIFCAFETVLLLIVHGTYIVRVKRFNNATMPPDAFRGLSPSMNSVGVAMRDSETADLLEKQADLIHYLKDHNIKLNQKLMVLNAQVRSSTSGNIPPN